ncbi:DUF362 domain-containing protein [Salinadaptatus halalkaliphilus]|uniref:DUF362 domain-containing protein n=2 Tax=Salinadaptatus halalkaliphilus TaxID=2419781 RepID=A0A4S3TGN3_9EURY|nr:DUF362 domain-containing protein [Salinadaptatus halalkaliphilus]
MATLETPLSSLLTSELDITPGTNALADADRITLVPDAHYPYHPSSGVVTDPAVVGATVAILERRIDGEVVVAGRSDDTISFERTAEYLGYESLLERFDADPVDLASEGHTDTRVTVGDDTVSTLVPSRLTRSTVVTMPSLRPTETGRVAGGLRTLAAMLEDGTDETDASADSRALGAARAIDPALSVLDATTVYAGEPYAANTLFAGPAAAVDAVGTSLLERSFEADDVVRRAFDDDRPSITVTPVGVDPESFDLESLRAALPTGGLPPADDTPAPVTAAYRLYAAVSGDVVPPQLEGGE